MFKRLITKFIMGIIGILIIWIVFSAYSIWSYGEKNELVKADAAIVLGAAAWGDKPSPVLKERVNHAVWLYQNGYVDKIIFTGGKGQGNQYAESETARAYAIEKKVDVNDILIESKSKITEENLKYAFEIAKDNHLNRFIIVSDPLHMKRAMFIAEHLGMKVYSSPTPSSVYKSLKSKIPFLLRELFFYLAYSVVMIV